MSATNAVERLPHDACWELLNTTTVGRLAVIVDGHPDVFPLNYLVDAQTVLFRSAPGTKLYGAIGSFPVALEADGYDAGPGQAWSVVVRGRAEKVKHVGAELIAALRLVPWQEGEKDSYVRIHPLSVSGRRFQVAKPDIWDSPPSDPRRASFG
ncbi:MAG: flavin-nucleotide-binding protein [Micrococcaceae bacterium]|nr:flavin-nucleotide-binding protein [Micrococcaceae bacterium]